MESEKNRAMSKKKWEEAHDLLATQIKALTDQLDDYMTGKKGLSDKDW